MREEKAAPRDDLKALKSTFKSNSMQEEEDNDEDSSNIHNISSNQEPLNLEMKI